MNAMNRRSSPGFGWSDKVSSHKPGKTTWLGDLEYDLNNSELREAVDERIELAKQGIRAPHLWVDTLKVERRPIDKVLAGKTRVFSVGQMDYILAVRKYFLGFNGHIMCNRINNEVAVGINAYSHEWTELANYLQRKGKNVVAGDFANYDGTLNPAILFACLDIINDFYDDGEENRKIRRVLFDEIVNSVHICGSVVYMWTHSQPSGNPLTTILNSMYNSLCVRIVYFMITNDMMSFSRNVSMISYGDDNVLNISDAIIDLFNQFTISSMMTRIGMSYTDESKGKNEIVKSRDLSGVEFLKRKFVCRHARYDAPLDLDTILEMTYWVRGDIDQGDLCKSNCENAFMELSLYDVEIFNHWSKLIYNACKKHNIFPTLHTYNNIRNMLFLGSIGGSRGVVGDDISAQ